MSVVTVPSLPRPNAPLHRPLMYFAAVNAVLVVPAGTEGVKVNALIAILAGDGEDVAAAAKGGNGAAAKAEADAEPEKKPAKKAPAKKAAKA